MQTTQSASTDDYIATETIMRSYIADLEDELDDNEKIFADEEALDNLIDLNDALKKVGYAREALIVLAHDPAFKAIINSDRNPQVALENHIAASTENMQDFLVLPIFGNIAGLWYNDMERQMRNLQKAISVPPSQEGLTSFFTRSIYLPKYTETVLILQGLKQMYAGMKAISVDPNLEIDPIVEGLRACSFNITKDMVVKKQYTIDWGAVIGSHLFGIAALWLPMIFPIPIIGSIVTTHAISSRGGTPESKGYTPENFVQCCKLWIELMQDLVRAKNLKSVKISKDCVDAAGKRRFIKSAAYIYTHTLRGLGRGLTEAYRSSIQR